MSNTEELTKKLASLVAESASRRDQRIESRSRQMGDLNARLDRFEALASKWLERDVLPRLQALSAALPFERPPRVGKESLAAFLERDSDEEFPASADLRAQFAHDAEISRAVLSFQVRIIPILMEYEKEAELSLALDETETPRLIEFLESCICRFAEDYLRVREPDSPYQMRQLVVDPVCGMSFHRAEAASTLEHNRQTLYFCTDECRERFEAEPGRYPA